VGTGTHTRVRFLARVDATSWDVELRRDSAGDDGRESRRAAHVQSLADAPAVRHKPPATSMADLQMRAGLHIRQNVTAEVGHRLQIRRMV
jgi:hypothetical protein